MDSESDVYDRLKKLFTTNGWIDDTDLVSGLETPLMRLCSYYLYKEKRRSYALDSVGELDGKLQNISFYHLFLYCKIPNGLLIISVS